MLTLNDDSLLILYVNYLNDDRIHTLPIKESLDRVAEICSKQFEIFFRKQNIRNFNILTHGFGAIIGGKLGIKMNRESLGSFHVNNLFGNVNT